MVVGCMYARVCNIEYSKQFAAKIELTVSPVTFFAEPLRFNSFVRSRSLHHFVRLQTVTWFFLPRYRGVNNDDKYRLIYSPRRICIWNFRWQWKTTLESSNRVARNTIFVSTHSSSLWLNCLVRVRTQSVHYAPKTIPFHCFSRIFIFEKKVCLYEVVMKMKLIKSKFVSFVVAISDQSENVHRIYARVKRIFICHLDLHYFSPAFSTNSAITNSIRPIHR